MARSTLVLVVVALGVGLACGTPMNPMPKAGGPCAQENVGACESPTRLLACREQTWAVISDCRGPGGCRQSGDTVECDTSLNGLGDRCNNVGRVRCDPDGGQQILRCRDGGVLELELSCPVRSGVQLQCVLSDAGLTCD
ncbi:MAG: hypothetical protein SFW67_06620 [Myxococcaceae bacterium]|nr:hypothetical protein [Myxococcaceae bacterium]